jgi:hypothetical protein
VPDWSFLTNHARVMVCIAHDPGVRLRDIAASLGITERSAYGIVTDLAESGYIVKERDGRRNRYHIQEHLPLRETTARDRTVGEVLDMLVDPKRRAGKPAKAKATAKPTAKPAAKPAAKPTAARRKVTARVADGRAAAKKRARRV